MDMNKGPHTTDRRWRARVLLGLLIALTTWTSAWPLNPSGAGMPVAVYEGQLSVDVREVPVREVLAVIGQQAGLRVHVDAAATRTVTAQFTDMALDQGLRRLLRAASLSHTLLYTRGPAGTVNLQEVRVFGEARGEVPTSHHRAPTTRAERAAALQTSLVQEAPAEPAQAAEPEQEVEPEAEDAEQGEDDRQD
jgi:type II secretory pathway component GspD/PulD (secretin)